MYAHINFMHMHSSLHHITRMICKYPGKPEKSCNIHNQSINQSNFYSANIPGVAKLSGATARSVFKCEVVEVVP